jgi:cold shock CspA family protein
MNDKVEGKIVFYSHQKQYGFIAPDNGSDLDLFFHLDQFDSGLTPAIGDRVTFLAEQDPKKRDRQRAKDVVPVK